MKSISSDSFNIQMPDGKLPQLKGTSQEKLEKAAIEFEGLFMDIVMKSMRETIPDSDALGDSKNTKFFQSMLDSEYSKQMGGKIGLSAAIIRQLSPQVAAAKKVEAEKAATEKVAKP